MSTCLQRLDPKDPVECRPPGSELLTETRLDRVLFTATAPGKQYLIVVADAEVPSSPNRTTLEVNHGAAIYELAPLFKSPEDGQYGMCRGAVVCVPVMKPPPLTASSSAWVWSPG